MTDDDQPTPRRRRRGPNPTADDDETPEAKQRAQLSKLVPTRRDHYGRARLDPAVIDDLEARHQWDARLWRA